MIKFHATILIGSSLIGFFGHYMQFGVYRATPWIPALVGFWLVVLTNSSNSKLNRRLALLTILAFGLLTSSMGLAFVTDDQQPIRKKVIFCLMSISAWATVMVEAFGVKKP